MGRRQYICSSILKSVRAILLIVVVIYSRFVLGQTDSTDTHNKIKIRPVYVSIHDLEALKKNSISSFDTSLNAFHQLNPYRKQNFAYQDLGLIGTPIQGLFLNNMKAPGFDLGLNRMNDWLYPTKGEAEKLIISPTPYTSLNYSQGEKELIFLEVLHTQNITRRWNMGIDYRRLKTNNYMFFNLDGEAITKVRIPSIYNVKLFSSYHNKSDKYYLLAAITYNKITLRETGGLLDPLSFDTTSGKRRVFENPLVNASNSTVQPAFFMKQYFRFGQTTFQTELKDSNTLDTLSFDFIPKGFFYHSIHTSKSTYSYKDNSPDSFFYPAKIFDDITNDSMVLKEITNTAGVVLKTNYKQFSNLIKLGAEQSNFAVFNSHHGQLSYYNLSVNGQLMAALTSKKGEIQLIGNGQFFLAGYNNRDYLIQALAKIELSKKVRLTSQFTSQRHMADYFQSRAFTNHIVWNQALSPTFRNGLESAIEWLPQKLKGGVNVSNFQNYNLYFFAKAPQGINFNYVHIYIANSIKLRKLTWHNRLSFQEAGKVYNLPKLAVSGGVFYENRYFKSNMLARFGMDYYWFSTYNADMYSPFTRQFVWQNTTKIGNYPYVDVYASAQVQTMNLFIRFEHINMGLTGKRYYATPFYPNPPRFFRFGVNWRLFY